MNDEVDHMEKEETQNEPHGVRQLMVKASEEAEECDHATIDFENAAITNAPTPTNSARRSPQLFTKVEKSLASLGFFTPSSRRIKDQKVKTMSFTREVDGKRMEVKADIIPGAVFGLPITADQDKWLALQKIIGDKLREDGQIMNPIRFKSAELLRLLNATKSGKNYHDVSEWLDVMMSTTIISDGVVYDAGQKKFARDRFRVFDRAVSFGKEMEDGTVADANYVWLSNWQLKNINEMFLLPLDLDTYRDLKTHIAKALVPHLQIWLFATMKIGSFEKRYDELCELFALTQLKAPSQILRQLKPALDELRFHGYLSKWRIEKTSDRKAFKIVFMHGEKFHRDRRRRTERAKSEPPIVIAESQAPQPEMPEPGHLPDVPLAPATTNIAPGVEPIAVQTEHDQIVDELAGRGILPSVAGRLLDGLTPDQLDRAADWIDYWDRVKKTNNVGPGLLHDLIRRRDPLPVGFETRRAREARLAAEDGRRQRAELDAEVERRHVEHCREVIDSVIAGLPEGEFERRIRGKAAEIASAPGFWGQRPETADQFARHDVRAELARSANLPTLPEFRARHLAEIARELQLDLGALGRPLEETHASTAPNAVYSQPTNEVPLEQGSATPGRNSLPQAA